MAPESPDNPASPDLPECPEFPVGLPPAHMPVTEFSYKRDERPSTGVWRVKTNELCTCGAQCAQGPGYTCAGHRTAVNGSAPRLESTTSHQIINLWCSPRQSDANVAAQCGKIVAYRCSRCARSGRWHHHSRAHLQPHHQNLYIDAYHAGMSHATCRTVWGPFTGSQNDAVPDRLKQIPVVSYKDSPPNSLSYTPQVCRERRGLPLLLERHHSTKHCPLGRSPASPVSPA